MQQDHPQTAGRLPERHRLRRCYGKPRGVPFIRSGKGSAAAKRGRSDPFRLRAAHGRKRRAYSEKRQLQIRLCLACWNPGQHGGEIFNPRENAKATGGYSYYVNTGEAAKTYSRNMDGWRDCYNLADLVLREIETAEYIAGHRLVKSKGSSSARSQRTAMSGTTTRTGHSWISFALEIGTTPAIPKEYEEFL